LPSSALPPSAEPPLRVEKIWDDPLDIVVSRSHPLAQAKRVQTAMLLEYRRFCRSRNLYPRNHSQNFGPLRDRIQVGMAAITWKYSKCLRRSALAGALFLGHD
jgi:DNA-binding transcriptional LysR family regulator